MSTVRSREVLIPPLSICRHHSTPPLLGSMHGMGSLGFRWSYADNFGILVYNRNNTNVRLANLIEGVQKAGLDVHDISLSSGSADVLGCEVVSGQRVLQWNGQTDITYSFSRTDGLFASSHQWASGGARLWSRVFLGAQQSWGSLNR